MTIQVGDRVPGGVMKTMGPDGATTIDADALFSGKRVVLFGVPGAFTPTCDREHLPGYLKAAEEISAKGFDTIACMSVNDVWVMHAWGERHDVGCHVLMLADGSADYTRALGLELDLSGAGMGTRCKRFSMVVQDGVVESVNIDSKGLDATTAQSTCGF